MLFVDLHVHVHVYVAQHMLFVDQHVAHVVHRPTRTCTCTITHTHTHAVRRLTRIFVRKQQAVHAGKTSRQQTTCNNQATCTYMHGQQLTTSFTQT